MCQIKEHTERLKLYNQGFNDREIAKELNLTRSTIGRWRQQNNLSSNVGLGAPRYAFSDLELNIMISKYAQGIPLRKIANELSTSVQTIRRKLKDLDLYKDPKKNIIFYKKKCKICGKYFWTTTISQYYCHRPCTYSYNETGKDKYFRYIMIKEIRAHFINLLKITHKKH